VSDQLATTQPLARHADVALWLPTRKARRRDETPWRLARAANDAASLTIAAAVAGLALGGPATTAFVLFALAALAVPGSYRRRRRLSIEGELRRVVGSLALACIAAGAAAVLIAGREGVGDTLAVCWLVASVLAATGRLVLYGAQRAAVRRAGREGRTLVVGADRIGRLTAERLLAAPQLGLRPIGFLDDGAASGEDAGLPVLGSGTDLEAVVESQGVDSVVVTFSTAPDETLVDIVRRAWKLDADVLVVPRLHEVEGLRSHVEHLGALPLVGLESADPDDVRFAIKYAIDRVVAGLALVALAPVLALVALAVRCALGRPILFRQQRVGRDGRVFEMLKFRTMHGAPRQGGEADAAWADRVIAGAQNGTRPRPAAADGESRRSAVGDLLRKLSLDELPQLWNVVRGDMSLVGPRPERVHYVRRFEDVVHRYRDRHRVKSGLTGWAQVHGLRGETSLADRVEWDNFYIENWSFWLDLKIVLMTFPALFGVRGGH
jgi:exopolysaccharide biosynthesis polyprenyl glycosylphosphotransferase